MDEVLWSLDVETKKQAEEVFNVVSENMPENSVIMCLLSNSKINPTMLSKLERERLRWDEQEHGWLFCEAGELKWRRLSSGNLRFVYLGNDQNKPQNAISGEKELEGLIDKQEQLIAWGLFKEGTYNEDNIAENFSYPIKEKPGENIPKNLRRLAFQILKCVDKESYEVRFWRHIKINLADTKEAV